MRLAMTLLFVAFVAACDENPETTPPSIVTAPPDHLPTGRSGYRPVGRTDASGDADTRGDVLPGDGDAVGGDSGPSAPPPWPVMRIVPGHYSPEFAEDYVALVNAERDAFDAEMAKPQDPPKDANEAKHRIISEKGRRQRLLNKPQLAEMTNEQISDVVSFNPDMPSGADEFTRLLKEHPQDLHICVDHGRWLAFRKEKEAAIAEYTRCGVLPDVTEDQRRYIHTQIAAARSQH